MLTDLANADEQALKETFVRYRELMDFGIPKFDRKHLTRMTRAGKFPAPVEISAGRIAWRLSDLLQWKRNRPIAKSARAA